MSEQMNLVNWFEIPAADLDRARTFYETVFDIEMKRVDMPGIEMVWFPMYENAMGATGSLVKTDGHTPSHEGTMIYLSVADIEGVLAKAAKNGGKILGEKFSIGEFGFIGVLEDTEGNRIGIHSQQ